jgi:hypothetical protein
MNAQTRLHLIPGAPGLASVLACLCACGGGDFGAIESRSGALVAENGRQLNGRQLNGVQLNGKQLNGKQLNGMQLNGKQLNGIQLNGIQLNGIQLNGIQLNGSVLEGTTLGGARLSGADLAGALMVGVLDDGSTVPLRLDAVVQDQEPSPNPRGHGPPVMDNGDVYFHLVSFSTDGATWSPLCGTDAAGATIAAIPVAGTWDPGWGVPGGGAHRDDPAIFTFACRHQAIAKCVEMGYKPWRSVESCGGGAGCARSDLMPHLQACTRLLRADYCGDGDSWTVDGTPIDLYDGVGIQLDTERWAFEAEWDEGGAVCLDEQRVASVGVAPCAAGLARHDCGHRSHFHTGTLLMDEVEP